MDAFAALTANECTPKIWAVSQGAVETV